VILLTSGTSGFASGCVFDIGALLLNAQRHAASIGQRSDDTILMNLPIHFSFALVAQALSSLVCGNRLVIGGPPFHVPSYLATLRDFGITISSLTPVLVRRLLEHDSQLPRELRVLTVGGDALAPEHTEALLRSRPSGELYLTYGLTQAGPRVSTLAAHAEPATRHASVGRPLAGTTVHLEPAPNHPELKQLFVSSATVMKRRIGITEGQPPELTPASRCIPTGDVFEEDGEGYLYFRARLSDFIVRNGEKICLAAVRRVALRLPDVVRARTVIIRDAAGGGEDFDLLLHTGADGHEPYPALLRKWLRHSEMPREIRTVGIEESQLAAYK
jgi:acyl-CoA synthetase (AMP-forming)/AMP-acid ligase II